VCLIILSDAQPIMKWFNAFNHVSVGTGLVSMVLMVLAAVATAAPTPNLDCVKAEENRPKELASPVEPANPQTVDGLATTDSTTSLPLPIIAPAASQTCPTTPEKTVNAAALLAEGEIVAQQPQAQTNPESNPNLTSPAATPKPPALQAFPRRRVDPKRVNPFTTTLLLNETTISHLSNWQVIPGVNSGTNRSTNPSFDGLLRLDSRVYEQLQNNVLTVDQLGYYLQLRTFQRSREITTLRIAPETLLGFQIQYSFMGACLPGFNANAGPNDICSYTPGLQFSRYDSTTFAPTQVTQTSFVGDIVTPESIAAIRQPGFQRGANGQQIGFDLFFPNAGTIPGNDQATESQVDREENIRDGLIGVFSRVRQVVQANSEKAVLGRTIKGLAAVAPNSDPLLASIWQPGVWMLPDAIPNLQGNGKPVNPNINPNLFFAANNARLPLGSLTLYHAGFSVAASLTPAQGNQRPPGRFDGVWIGLTPVLDRTLRVDQFLQPTGDLRIIAANGGEGGTGSLVINGIPLSANNLADIYSQTYLTFFSRNVNRVTQQSYRETTSYVPHLSYTGNITSNQALWRYFTGVIASRDPKFYIGSDYNRRFAGGWQFQTAGVGYTNPDPDYYSLVTATLSNTQRIGRLGNISFSAGFNYAIDRNTQIDRFVIDNDASSVALSARANFRPFSIGILGIVGGLLPNSQDSSVTLDARLRLHEYVSLVGYWSPYNQNSSFSRLGAGLQIRWGKGINSPTFNFTWANNRYNFGSDPFSNQIVNSENIFSVRIRFGTPQNPFDATTSERLRQQRPGQL
jgi:hypothetical protein